MNLRVCHVGQTFIWSAVLYMFLPRAITSWCVHTLGLRGASCGTRSLSCASMPWKGHWGGNPVCTRLRRIPSSSHNSLLASFMFTLPSESGVSVRGLSFRSLASARDLDGGYSCLSSSWSKPPLSPFPCAPWLDCEAAPPS